MKKLIILFLFLFISNFSFAQQETLAVDTSFGEDGIYTEENLFYGAFIVFEDKIYLGGVGGSLESPFFRLIRLNLNGTPDMTFNNSNYYVDYEQFDFSTYNDNFVNIVPQSDGKILAMTDEVLFRLNPDGSIDTSFGEQGIIQTPLNQNLDVGYNNGKIYRIYHIYEDGIGKMMMDRRNINGEIDLDFGVNGSIYFGFTNFCSGRSIEFFQNGDLLSRCEYRLLKVGVNGNNYNSWTESLLRDAKIQNEKILVVYRLDSFERLVRLNSNFSTDTTFGENGYIPFFYNNIDINLLNVYNNKIYLLGSSFDGPIMLRRLENGDPDNSFSGNGTYTFQNIPHASGEFFLQSFKIINDDIYIYGKNTLTNKPFIYKYNLMEDLSTNEQFTNGVKIYPNPSTDKLYFENLKKKSTVKIVNAEGKFIMEKTIEPNGYADISALPKGVYVAILDGNSYKFIKN